MIKLKNIYTVYFFCINMTNMMVENNLSFVFTFVIYLKVLVGILFFYFGFL